MEVCNGEIWSIACANVYGINEAKVICRQLGFNSTYVNYTQHVQIINSIEMQGELIPLPTFNSEFVGCFGNELSLLECAESGFGGRRKRGVRPVAPPTCQYQAGVQCGGM